MLLVTVTMQEESLERESYQVFMTCVVTELKMLQSPEEAAASKSSSGKNRKESIITHRITLRPYQFYLLLLQCNKCSSIL